MRTYLAAAVLAALTLAPAAGAWTKLTGDTLQNIVDPAVVVLPDGTELIAYREPVAGTFKVIHKGLTATLVSGRPIVGDGVILRQPSGALLLYFSDEQGVVRSTSSDGGGTWSAPVATESKDVGDVQAGALRPDGTPLFSQDGTGFVNVYTGTGGEAVANAFPLCCGYAESLAVDAAGLAQVAFWSNATGQSGYLVGPVGGPYQDLTGGKDSLANDARVPLVADGLGNTFLAWQTGYPDADAFIVSTYRGGSLAHTVRFAGKYSQPDPHMALSVDASGRLWGVWTRQGAVWAARSRSHGAHFGAAVHVAEPGSVYQLEAGARPDGSVDAVANTGSNLQAQRLLPGLTVVASRTSARVLDDGFAVSGATLKGGGRTLHTNPAGRASLAGVKAHAFVSVSASGYTSTGFRVP
jgi:hypothetical protein